MSTQYINVNWQFDKARWSEAMKNAVDEHGVSDIAELMELSESQIYNWSNGYFHPATPYPNMTNFLAFCNLVDIRPAFFFWVGEGETNAV